MLLPMHLQMKAISPIEVMLQPPLLLMMAISQIEAMLLPLLLLMMAILQIEAMLLPLLLLMMAILQIEAMMPQLPTMLPKARSKGVLAMTMEPAGWRAGDTQNVPLNMPSNDARDWPRWQQHKPKGRRRDIPRLSCRYRVLYTGILLNCPLPPPPPPPPLLLLRSFQKVLATPS
jgi:hypothetical protein